MTDDDVVSVDEEGCSCHTDTVAGRSLAKNGDIGRTDIDGRLKFNDSGDVEHYGTCPTLLAGFAQCAGTFVGKRGDNIDLAAASAGSICTSTLSTRESQDVGFDQILWL